MEIKMDMYTLQAIVAVGAVITALATAGAAFFAARSAAATRRSAESTLASRLMEQYAEPQMDQALKRLQEFYTMFPPGNFTKNTIPSKLSAQADEARRKVKYYFLTVYNLKIQGFIGCRTLNIVANVAGLEVLTDIVKPMEMAKPKHANTDWIDKLEKFVKH